MSLEVIVVRHAIACERDRARWRDDRQRPLSAEGKRKFRAAAAGLAKWLPRPDALLTSPLVRTRQTAEILTQIARWPEGVDCPELAPDAGAAAVLAVLRAKKVARIALVGHEPNLSTLIAFCIAGPEAGTLVRMKKGAAAVVLFESEIAAGKGVLTALAPPRALRRMA